MTKRRRRPSRQECSKKLDGECFLCPQDDYHLLQAHRIFPGEEGGKYHPWNILSLCLYCHEKVTRGRIKVHAAHPSTFAVRVIHWTDEQGNEHWSPWPKRRS